MPSPPIIYLLDDDSSFMKSLSRLLAAGGYQSRCFGDVAHFFQAAASQPTRLAVLDYMMPELTGLQVQECLRSFAPTTRVIMISADFTSKVRDQALKSGAFGFISKPFDAEIFLRTVRESLGSAS